MGGNLLAFADAAFAAPQQWFCVLGANRRTKGMI
jgi:hypothetical protein